MKKLMIDKKFLLKFDPCSEGLAEFVAAFPEGVELTDDQTVNFERLGGRLARHYDDGVNCPGVSANYWWLLQQLGYSSDIKENVGCRGIICSHDEFLVAGMFADAVGVYLKEQGAA